MFMGKRGHRASTARRRRGHIQLRAEGLEGRQLMAIDLVNVASAPYGVQNIGLTPANGVGFKVANVGDLTGDGYDDYLIGGPSVALVNGNLVLGNGSGSQAFLVFGSRAVNQGTIDFALLNSQQRLGDLSQLGNSTQFNPLNGNTGLPFDGLTFTTSLNTNSQLGVSVAALGDLNGDGFGDFIIGAPGAFDANGTAAGTGRAYIVYGGPTLVTPIAKTVDLDNPLTYPTAVVTIESTNPGAGLGYSGAAVGNLFGTGGSAVAIGAPFASANGQSQAGEVGVLNPTVLASASTRVINFDKIGQTGATGVVSGVMFAGQSAQDQAGFSVAGAGNFDGNTVGSGVNIGIDDLLIGAPQTGVGAGQAYLIYGAANLPSLATTLSGLSPIAIALNRIGNPSTTGNVAGASFTGASNSLVGYSVSTAGNFSGGLFSDILIGAPNAGGAGVVALVKGRAFANRLYGPVDLSNLTAANQVVAFVGAQSGALAGYSVTVVGDINKDGLDEIAIGSPGYNANAGTVYVIPGNINLTGTHTLSDATAPVLATQINLTGSVGPAFFGASVSGRITTTGRPRTTDNDTIGDLIIGAPGYGYPTPATPTTTSRPLAGSGFLVEGRFLPLQTPSSTPVGADITTQLGIGGVVPGPFTVNAGVASLQFYVYPNEALNFLPVTDINPASIVVNGVAYPNATVSADGNDGSGNPIAIVTITPVSNLNLTNGSGITFTVTGTTTAATGSRTFSASNTATVIGANVTPPVGPVFSAGQIPVGFQQNSAFIPPLGESFVPSLVSLSHLQSYKPLPVSVAINQFLPSGGWLLRQEIANGQISRSARNVQRHEHAKFLFSGSGVNTLPGHVFTRSVYHPGKLIRVRHAVKVVPLGRQTDIYP